MFCPLFFLRAEGEAGCFQFSRFTFEVLKEHYRIFATSEPQS